MKKRPKIRIKKAFIPAIKPGDEEYLLTGTMPTRKVSRKELERMYGKPTKKLKLAK